MNPVHDLRSCFFKIYFNILPSNPTSSKWPLSFTFPHQNSAITSLLPHTCNTSSSSFLMTTEIIFCAQHKSWSCHYVIFSSFLHFPLRPKRLPQHPVPEHPHPELSPYCDTPSHTATHTHTHTHTQCAPLLTFFNSTNVSSETQCPLQKAAQVSIATHKSAR